MVHLTHLDEYQREAARTLISKPDSTYTNEQLLLVYKVLELAAVTGALVDYVKKGVFHQHGTSEHVLQQLIADVLAEARILHEWSTIAIVPGVPDSIVFDDAAIMRVWCALGLVGEAGEVATTVERALFAPHEDFTPDLTKELGDVGWYQAAIATLIGVKLSTIASVNIDKLRKRYGAQGYTAEQSRQRVDVDGGAA